MPNYSQPERHPSAAQPPTSDFDAKRLNRLYQRNRAVADLKQSLSLLAIIASCVSVIYLLGHF